MNTQRAFIMSAWLALAVLLPSASTAAAPKAPPDTPTAAERPFISKATADMQRLYPTTADAAKAGYFRYTDEDETGAISWVNLHYWKSDEAHPSQLWYDVKGRLLGVDYSLAYTDPKHPPTLWGMLPARWFKFEAHVHYGIRDKNGTIKFGYLMPKGVKKVGGDPDHPTVADIVKAGKAKSAKDVAFVFAFPDVWDLEFWTLPNSKGAFAAKNPAVKPSHVMKAGM